VIVDIFILSFTQVLVFICGTRDPSKILNAASLLLPALANMTFVLACAKLLLE
jgi:hypothetical protein